MSDLKTHRPENLSGIEQARIEITDLISQQMDCECYFMTEAQRLAEGLTQIGKHDVLKIRPRGFKNVFYALVTIVTNSALNNFAYGEEAFRFFVSRDDTMLLGHYNFDGCLRFCWATADNFRSDSFVLRRGKYGSFYSVGINDLIWNSENDRPAKVLKLESLELPSSKIVLDETSLQNALGLKSKNPQLRTLMDALAAANADLVIKSNGEMFLDKKV